MDELLERQVIKAHSRRNRKPRCIVIKEIEIIVLKRKELEV